MRYRCTHRQNGQNHVARPCGKRVKLRKPIEQYVRRPLCPGCGRDSLKLDVGHHRRKRKLKCTCSGVPYPHERGTILGCESYTRPFTEEDYRDYLDQLKEASKKAA